MNVDAFNEDELSFTREIDLGNKDAAREKVTNSFSNTGEDGVSVAVKILSNTVPRSVWVYLTLESNDGLSDGDWFALRYLPAKQRAREDIQCILYFSSTALSCQIFLAARHVAHGLILA